MKFMSKPQSPDNRRHEIRGRKKDYHFKDTKYNGKYKPFYLIAYYGKGDKG